MSRATRKLKVPRIYFGTSRRLDRPTQRVAISLSMPSMSASKEQLRIPLSYITSTSLHRYAIQLSAKCSYMMAWRLGQPYFHGISTQQTYLDEHTSAYGVNDEVRSACLLKSPSRCPRRFLQQWSHSGLAGLFSRNCGRKEVLRDYHQHQLRQASKLSFASLRSHYSSSRSASLLSKELHRTQQRSALGTTKAVRR